MPADGISRCHSPRTETSARPVSKSSSKEDYTIPRLSKRPSYWPGRGTNNSVNTSGSNVRVGSKAELTAPKSSFRYTPQSGLRADNGLGTNLNDKFTSINSSLK
jgi:hypothetical protein